ncbi:hypothetical protein ABK040_006625 [Willaertia magna]
MISSSNNKSISYRGNTFTITFGDQAENHVGMQKIGNLSKSGFNLTDLQNIKEWFEKNEIECELLNLNDNLPDDIKCKDEAYVLVMRKGLNGILKDIQSNSDEFFKEQDDLDKDTKAYMYGRVVNKVARYNLCFGEESQEANYEEGKGSIIAFDTVPLLNHVKLKLIEICEKAEGLVAEGNYYYDISKCGIGFHGDAERMKVIGVRIGETLPLHYQWFQQSSPIGERVVINLGHGDMYIMSEKATGNDWKLKKIPTLRHAAGCKKYLTIPEKKVTKKKKEEENEENEELVEKKKKKVTKKKL